MELRTVPMDLMRVFTASRTEVGQILATWNMVGIHALMGHVVSKQNMCVTKYLSVKMVVTRVSAWNNRTVIIQLAPMDV